MALGFAVKSFRPARLSNILASVSMKCYPKASFSRSSSLQDKIRLRRCWLRPHVSSYLPTDGGGQPIRRSEGLLCHQDRRAPPARRSDHCLARHPSRERDRRRGGYPIIRPGLPLPHDHRLLAIEAAGLSIPAVDVTRCAPESSTAKGTPARNEPIQSRGLLDSRKT